MAVVTIAIIVSAAVAGRFSVLSAAATTAASAVCETTVTAAVSLSFSFPFRKGRSSSLIRPVALAATLLRDGLSRLRRTALAAFRHQTR